MKFLILYTYRKKKSYNHWGSFDYFHELKKYGHDLMFYGPGMVKSSIPYIPKSSIIKLKNKFNYDFVIINCVNRAYLRKMKNEWVITDSIPTILIEPDFHNLRDYSFFERHNVKLIIHRHRSNYNRAIKVSPKINHELLYSSVDEKIFYPRNNVRIDKVCFVGTSSTKSTYLIREKAIRELRKGCKKFINCGQVKGAGYVDLLNKYKIYLNGSSVYDIENTKVFEILSCGGVPLTNRCSCALNELLDGNIIEYSSDCSDILDVARDALSDTNRLNNIAKMGREVILKRHTHFIRVGELLAIIKKYEDLVIIK